MSRFHAIAKRWFGPWHLKVLWLLHGLMCVATTFWSSGSPTPETPPFLGIALLPFFLGMHLREILAEELCILIPGHAPGQLNWFFGILIPVITLSSTAVMLGIGYTPMSALSLAISCTCLGAWLGFARFSLPSLLCYGLFCLQFHQAFRSDRLLWLSAGCVLVCYGVAWLRLRRHPWSPIGRPPIERLHDMLPKRPFACGNSTPIRHLGPDPSILPLVWHILNGWIRRPILLFQFVMGVASTMLFLAYDPKGHVLAPIACFFVILLPFITVTTFMPCLAAFGNATDWRSSSLSTSLLGMERLRPMTRQRQANALFLAFLGYALAQFFIGILGVTIGVGIACLAHRVQDLPNPTGVYWTICNGLISACATAFINAWLIQRPLWMVLGTLILAFVLFLIVIPFLSLPAMPTAPFVAAPPAWHRPHRNLVHPGPAPSCRPGTALAGCGKTQPARVGAIRGQPAAAIFPGFPQPGSLHQGDGRPPSTPAGCFSLTLLA